MRAIIVDDERLARKELVTLLKEHSQIEVIGEAVNADDAFEMINTLQPDFLI